MRGERSWGRTEHLHPRRNLVLYVRRVQISLMMPHVVVPSSTFALSWICLCKSSSSAATAISTSSLCCCFPPPCRSLASTATASSARPLEASHRGVSLMKKDASSANPVGTSEMAITRRYCTLEASDRPFCAPYDMKNPMLRNVSRTTM